MHNLGCLAIKSIVLYLNNVTKSYIKTEQNIKLHMREKGKKVGTILVFCSSKELISVLGFMICRFQINYSIQGSDL